MDEPVPFRGDVAGADARSLRGGRVRVVAIPCGVGFDRPGDHGPFDDHLDLAMPARLKLTASPDHPFEPVCDVEDGRAGSIVTWGNSHNPRRAPGTPLVIEIWATIRYWTPHCRVCTPKPRRTDRSASRKGGTAGPEVCGGKSVIRPEMALGALQMHFPCLHGHTFSLPARDLIVLFNRSE